MFLSEAVVHSYLRCSSRAHRMNVFTGGGKTKNTSTLGRERALSGGGGDGGGTWLFILPTGARSHIIAVPTSAAILMGEQECCLLCEHHCVRLHASVRMTNKFRTPLCIRAERKSQWVEEAENARAAVPNQMTRAAQTTSALLFPTSRQRQSKSDLFQNVRPKHKTRNLYNDASGWLEFDYYSKWIFTAVDCIHEFQTVYG